MAAYLLVLLLPLVAESRHLAAVQVNASVNAESDGYYTAAYGIELANTSTVANPVLALAPSAGVESQLGFTGQWTTFSQDSGVIAIHSVLTSDNYVLFMERPGNREAPPNIGAVYNLNTNEYVYLPFMDSPFCSAHIQLIDDRILVVGGDNVGLDPTFTDGRYLIRVVDSGPLPNYTVVATMQPFFPPEIDPNSGARWYPSVMTVQDGSVLIVGGQTTEGGEHNDGTSVNPTYQFFDPRGDVLSDNVFLAALLQSNPINLYPFLAVLSNGQIMMTIYESTYFYAYQGAYQLANSTAGLVVPDLPHPASYPYTASPVLLPISGPAYQNRVLIVGGTTDYATAPTPALATSYLLDFSVAPLAWQEEQMSVARVMPDAVLLPDGTVLIVNGANFGIAGGAPGTGLAANLNNLGARAAEIYNPTLPVGQRYSGLLANSGLDRLYHSNAFLTINGDVLVAGSETSEDYIMQTFTPPYLVGNPNRPVISQLSGEAWGYGEVYNVSVGWTQTTAYVDTAVLIKSGGVTHSVHFDQRMVELELETLSEGAGVLQAPPNSSVAPPGLYMLFLLSEGVPSTAVWVGVGGAVPPQTAEPIAMAAPQAELTPLANGVYTISSFIRSQTPNCRSYLTVPACTAAGAVNTASLALTDTGTGTEHWRFTLLPDGSYLIQNQERQNTSCTDFLLSTVSCVPGTNIGTTVDVYSVDDGSGRQEWNVRPAQPVVQGVMTTQFYITVSAGRFCGQNYLAALDTCPATSTVLPTAADGLNLTGPAITPDQLQVWDILPVATPATSRPLPDGTYTVQGRTRTLCNSYLQAAAPCPAGNVSLAPIDTGSGAQRWNLNYIPGTNAEYYLQVACTHANCASLLSTRGLCNGTDVILAEADDGSGDQRWRIQNVARGPNAAWNIIAQGPAGCARTYLSTPSCLIGNALALANGDDGTGAEQFLLQPVGLGCP